MPEEEVVLKAPPVDPGGTEQPFYKYKFNGMEWQDELGLNVYDMLVRDYDPAIGRWTGIDPVTHFDMSPYNGMDNNPIYFADPSGADGVGMSGMGNYYLNWAANQAYLNSSLGSSSNWGQSAVGGSSIDFMSNFENSAYSTTDETMVGRIIGSYARQSGYSGFTYSYADSFNYIHGGGTGFYQYSTKGSGINGLSGSWDNSKSALDIGGGLYGGLRGMTSSQGMWLGKNGKYYSKAWGGNQYTGSRSGAFKAASQYKVAGAAVIGVSAVIGGVETYNGYLMDGGQFGYNAQSAAAQTAGNIAGGWAGAEVGAWGLGIVGGLIAGPPGAVIGAAIGGFIGGYYGGEAGGNLSQGTINYYHDK